MTGPLNVAVALLPVLLFLGLLVFLDSFKLVSLRSVLVAVLAGGAAALVGAQLNGWLLDATGLAPAVFSRYLAPPRGGDAEGGLGLGAPATGTGGLPGRRRDPGLRGGRGVRARRERRVPAGAGRAAPPPLARPRVRDSDPPRSHDGDLRPPRQGARRPAPRARAARLCTRAPRRVRRRTRSTTTSSCRRFLPRGSSWWGCLSSSLPCSSGASGRRGTGSASASTATSTSSGRSSPARRSRRGRASTCGR